MQIGACKICTVPMPNALQTVSSRGGGKGGRGRLGWWGGGSGGKRGGGAIHQEKSLLKNILDAKELHLNLIFSS